MAMRELVHQGVTWTIWDVRPTSVARLRLTGATEVLEAGWLCFECRGEKRRVVPIPEGWEAWSDDDLGTCLEGAEVHTRRSADPARG